MNVPALTEPARRLLIDEIGSLARLDILLLMQHDEERWWNMAALANELRIPMSQVEEGLNVLGQRNLVNVRIADHVLYRFDPGTPELRRLVEEIVNVHYANRGAVAAVVSARPSSAQLFADAFRLWRDPNDG
jgi:hypothetical protein